MNDDPDGKGIRGRIKNLSQAYILVWPLMQMVWIDDGNWHGVYPAASTTLSVPRAGNLVHHRLDHEYRPFPRAAGGDYPAIYYVASTFCSSDATPGSVVLLVCHSGSV